MPAIGAFEVEGVESVMFVALRLLGFRGCPQKLGTLEACHVSEASGHLFSSRELAFVPQLWPGCQRNAVASHDKPKTIECGMPIHLPSSPSPPCGISPYNSGDRLLLTPRGLVSCVGTDDGVGSTEATCKSSASIS